MNNSTKNDIAWARLFEKYSALEEIESKGSFLISAGRINEFREARLMAKMDHRANRPEIFKKHSLSILSIGRGLYLIGEFDGYKGYNSLRTGDIHYAPPPDWAETLQYQRITSESVAVNCAYAAGIFDDFLEQTTIPTVSGRMGGGRFAVDLKFSRHGIRRIAVENPQIEIDIALEGRDSLALVEAKNALFSDFIIRQLYYPYRAWLNETQKTVRPIYFVYSNGIITLSEYEFIDFIRYDSIEIRRSKHYSIVPCNITLDELIIIAREARTGVEPNVPFPQADSFERVINLIEVLQRHDSLTREDITTLYDFDVRQTNYYTDAGRYLGLIEKYSINGNVAYQITHTARRILNLHHKEKQLSLARLVLQHVIFRTVFLRYISQGYPLQREQVVFIMRNNNPRKIASESTFSRRAFTVMSWIDWIMDLQT